MLLKYACGKENLESVVYVTLRKCFGSWAYLLLKYAYRGKNWYWLYVSLRKCFGSWVYLLLKYAYRGKNWSWLYVTLRKCSRACEYFSPRYAYVGGKLVLSPH